MRELKFRAWDGEKIRYDVTGFEHGHKNEMGIIFLDGDPYYLNEDWAASLGSDKKAVAMQHTGLKDKNGKEIYEGDIVEKHYFDKGHRYVIGYIESEASFMLRYEGRNVGSPLIKQDADDNLSVIGNIHENLELLDGA